MKFILIITLFLSLFGCKKVDSLKITSVDDYNKYLSVNETSKNNTLDEMTFWQSRLTKDSINTIALSKLSGLYNTMFSISGNISDLKTAEKLTIKALQLSARDKDTYLRSLARNYITQHRFIEAKILLDSAYGFSDNKRATELMLFDVSMELGEYKNADKLLGKIKNNSDYNYLIRLSKWSDYQGNLDAAIRYMEKAKTIAEASGAHSLKIWTYSNIADFYGHAGRLKDAYNHYLMTLALQPDNTYAKKGIAWIVYSSEKNITEATRILDSISSYHKVPDYHLFKADMAEWNKNFSEEKEQKSLFIEAVDNEAYGGMYNTYLIELFSETNPLKALELAKIEVANRATPETYQLLAMAQLNMGMTDKALITIEKYVTGRTFEPMALFTTALVYKANNMTKRIPELKAELLGAAFELGPTVMLEIDKL